MNKKTSVEIPIDILKDLLKFTKSKTQKEAIIIALTEFNQRHRMKQLTRHLGTCNKIMSKKELMATRNSK